MKNRILYIVATQYDNVGDLLINKCLINELSKYGEVYLDTRNVPNDFKKSLLFDTKNVYELSGLTRYSYKGLSFIKLLFTDLGFTHVFKSPGPFGSGGNIKSFVKIFILGIVFYILRQKGAKPFLVGNDMLYKHQLDKICVNFFSKSVYKILCRTSVNVQGLKNLGIMNVGYIPDMCFAMETKVSDDFIKRRKIGVSFRNMNDETLHQSILESLSNLIRACSKLDIEIEFFYQVQHDFKYNQALFEYFVNTFVDCAISFRSECLTWSDLNIYSEFKAVVSNRLHVLLLGVVHEVIPIGILNSDKKTIKINGIFKDIGLEASLFNCFNQQDVIIFQNINNEQNYNIIRVSLEQRELLTEQIKMLFA